MLDGIVFPATTEAPMPRNYGVRPYQVRTPTGKDRPYATGADYEDDLDADECATWKAKRISIALLVSVGIAAGALSLWKWGGLPPLAFPLG